MADTVILPEQTIGGFSEVSPGIMALNVPMAIPVVVGETYRVTWGADDFVCKAMEVNGQTGFGNLAVAGLGADTQEPFLVAFSTNSTTILTNDTGITTVNVAIYQVVEADKEYLIWGSTLKEIGKAIREKTGKTDDIPPLDMPGEIRGITGGGSDVEVVYVTFLNHDGSGEPFVRPVVPGNTCLEPVGAGLMATPTRESTVSQNFTFSGGWATTPNGGADANALKNVTEGRTVYANFIATTRVYTIRYFDDDGTLLHSEPLAYGAMPKYVPTKDGCLFDSWQPAISAVAGDADYHAKWMDSSAVIADGVCGTSAVTWAVTKGGELIISGEGAMPNYSSSGTRPWSDYATDINKVTVKNITSIGEYAFYNHNGITDVVIENGVAIIGSYAFSGCTNLVNIDLPDAMNKIGSNSFNNTAITTLAVPALSEASNAAFRMCYSLKTVTVLEGNTHIYYSMFSDCTSMESISFPATLVEVNCKAFWNCNALKSVVFAVTDGWKRGSIDLDVSDPSDAASDLKSDAGKSTQYYWKRT